MIACGCIAGTHDVLRVALKGDKAASSAEEEVQRTVLLPFAHAVVPVVDRAKRRMEITPPEGLLELVTTAKKAAKKSAKKAASKKSAKNGNPCWPGFVPVPGKEPGTKGSCKPEPGEHSKAAKKATKKAAAASKLEKAGKGKAKK